MLTFFGGKQQFCDGVSRRDFLRVGALAVGGLTLADLLRLEAQGAASGRSRGKAIIMIYLPGGPTHMDTYDLKPQAASEFRGEFAPIHTNVPGVDICELMPRQASIMDKMSIVRGIHFYSEHSPHGMITGVPTRTERPSFGSVISYLKGKQAGLPPYVSLNYMKDSEKPLYTGAAHQPFVPSGPGLQNLSLESSVSLERLGDRKALLQDLDTIRRDIDYGGALAGIDAFNTRAIDMVASSEARDAFDIEKEPRSVRERYGEANAGFLKARRLVEAGVSVVTLTTGGWDTHGQNFKAMRNQLPRVDQGVHALVTDLHERGMGKDVAVVMWGEFGRTPRINPGAGRDHWPQAGFALLAGGNLNHGQAIGETDARGERSLGRAYTPANVLATLYHHMGIDPGLTINDNNGRPTPLVDDRELIREMV